MPHLFSSFTLRGVTLRNRIGVSPMCQYSSEEGMASDWHLVHLGSRAVGGAGLVLTEAAAVAPRGRISPYDLGIWSEDHIEPLARITRFVAAQGAVPGIQLAHAGRKGSRSRPWEGGRPVPEEAGGWPVVGPSAVAFGETYREPAALTEEEIQGIQEAFQKGAVRALEAGFRWLEIHAAHGYLLHSFHSPLSNRRTDAYGGSLEGRIRFTLETVRRVRHVWPEELPLAVRISATDWMEGGWTADDSVELARRLRPEGVDLVDCSSAGSVPNPAVPVGAGYQVRFAERIRREAGLATAAVGLITEPMQADGIIRDERADLVLLARAMLRDPYWPLRAAAVVRQQERAPVPPQYERAY